MTDPALPPAPTMTPEAILDELACYLRPPGQGVHTVSTGKAQLRAKTRAYLGLPPFATHTPSSSGDDELDWREHLRAIPEAKVALLAIPCDTGAGIVRGCARGPEAIREALGEAPCFELGDVFCVPHFLTEDMLSTHQRRRSQAAIYPQVDAAARAAMPVAPISIATRVYELVAALNPDMRIMMLGGDHSVTWAAMDALLGEHASENADVGIVHFDAHTDLLEERLGVRICFATWAFHANQRLGGGERMLQLGIRASGHDRGHWEATQGVRQIWPDEAKQLGATRLAAAVLSHLRERGLKRIYLSNDIDGTDAHFAAACGTPEPGGLHPDEVIAVIDALRGAEDLRLIGADLVELAPALGENDEARSRSIDTAARYTRSSIQLLQDRA